MDAITAKYKGVEISAINPEDLKWEWRGNIAADKQADKMHDCERSVTAEDLSELLVA